MKHSTVQRAYRFRFYPTREQEHLLRCTLGCCRKVYNMALEYRSEAWHQHQQPTDYKTTAALLVGWKKTEEYAYLKDVSSVPLQQALRHLQAAFKKFFDHQGGYPKFKAKHDMGSATFMRSAFTWDGGNLTLAKMREPLPIRWSRTLPKNTQPSSITISLTPAGRWYVSILCKTEVEQLPKSEHHIGIDMGVADFAITSDGMKIANPRHYAKYARRLTKAQQNLARKQKGSANYQKARREVARIYARIRDTRHDFLHKLSTQLIRENQTIVLEDLHAANMTKRCKPKPDPDKPDTYLPNGQAAKSGLNRNILDCGWSEFRQMLTYKAQWYGRQLIILDQWYPSSQICHTCGKNTGKKPLNVRTWQCPYCHTVQDRDINAAHNILAAGLAVKACGDTRLQHATIR